MAPSAECLVAVQKMSSCPACQGLPDVRPCHGLCANVMKGCMAHHYHIDEHWAKFIGNYHTNSGLGTPTLGFGETLGINQYLPFRIPDKFVRATGRAVQRGDDGGTNQYQDFRCNNELSRIRISGTNQMSIKEIILFFHFVQQREFPKICFLSQKVKFAVLGSRFVKL